jgi:hypothetical protein
MTAKKRIVHDTIVTLGPDGLWRDEKTGVIYALPDEAASADDVVCCGVGAFSLPEDHEFTAGCAAHDRLYQNPQFQASNPRSRADKILLDHLLSVAGSNPLKRAAAYAMYWAARLFGARYWEDGRTRDL